MPESSRFLAFTKWSTNKMQLVKVVFMVLFFSLAVINSVVIQLAKVLQPADMDLKTYSHRADWLYRA